MSSSLDVLTEWLNSTQAQRLLASELVDKLKMFFMAELTTISAIKANRILSTAQLKDEQRLQDPLKYGLHPQGRIRSLLSDITMHQGLLNMTPSLLNREDVTVREIAETLTMVRLAAQLHNNVIAESICHIEATATMRAPERRMAAQGEGTKGARLSPDGFSTYTAVTGANHRGPD